MSRHKRTWHPEFLRYMKFIVNHPNYKDLPNKFKENGKIRWVSPSDKERAAWWDKKIVELGLHSRAEVARGNMIILYANGTPIHEISHKDIPVGDKIYSGDLYN